jgi:two-component system response regulator HydG/two-component system response regulator AtoC
MSVISAIVAVEDQEVRSFLKTTLERNGLRLEECLQESRLLRILENSNVKFLFLGHPAVTCPFSLAKRVRNIAPNTLILLITKTGSESAAVAAIRAGINNYIRFPSEKEAILRYLHNELDKGKLFTIDEQTPNPPYKRLVGKSQFVHQLRFDLQRASSSDSNILITGETGTGKELAAELIHENSSRRDHPFECINCAALPDTLLETELFGHERGAFTGAINSYEGKLSLADKGTILFDEIGDMSVMAQAKILRIIEGKPYHRLGGRKLIRPDVRFITATNRDLETMTAGGQFRDDLFFRINVNRIHLMPLRERMEDIPLLLKDMISTFNIKYRRRVFTIPKDVLQLFLRHDWPGNIRELLNTIEATYANLTSDEIRFIDLPSGFTQKVTRVTTPGSEQNRLLEALRATDWNLSKAAKRLSLSRTTIYRKMAKFQISRQVSFTEDQPRLYPTRAAADAHRPKSYI